MHRPLEHQVYIWKHGTTRQVILHLHVDGTVNAQQVWMDHWGTYHASVCHIHLYPSITICDKFTRSWCCSKTKAGVPSLPLHDRYGLLIIHVIVWRHVYTVQIRFLCSWLPLWRGDYSQSSGWCKCSMVNSNLYNQTYYSGHCVRPSPCSGLSPLLATYPDLLPPVFVAYSTHMQKGSKQQLLQLEGLGVRLVLGPNWFCTHYLS